MGAWAEVGRLVVGRGGWCAGCCGQAGTRAGTQGEAGRAEGPLMGKVSGGHTDSGPLLRQV